MPATIVSILNSAQSEWMHWGESTWHVPTDAQKVGHVDNEKKYAQYVIDKYCSIGGGSPSLQDIQNDEYFWSAVGMSAIMKNAGFTKKEFPFAQSHSVFIRHFISARRAKDHRAAYWGFRAGEAGGSPVPGDIVAYARGKNMTPEKARALFDRDSSYKSHSDVVVAKQPGEIEVIGCNVGDTVARKTLAIDAQGHIRDDRHFWFAVLKRRDI